MAFRGTISLPGDKSISHRAALFAALRKGESRFVNFSKNDDCASTLSCLKQLGVASRWQEDVLIINGMSPAEWHQPAAPLYAGNSGTTSRLLSGLLIHLPFATQLTGDNSLSRRPMERIITPLSQMGGQIESADGHLPLSFYPAKEIHGIHYPLPVASAQIKSAVALAGLYAEGETIIIESTPSRDHTERMLGLPFTYKDGRKYIHVKKGHPLPDLSMTIPGDISSAAFFIVAALLTPGSDITLQNISLNPTRTALLTVLKHMGGAIDITPVQEKPEPIGHIRVRHSRLQNIPIDQSFIPNLIDEIPILSLAGVKAVGHFEIRGASELRVKETDRIRALVENWRRAGLSVKEFDDGFSFCGPQQFEKTRITTFGDHRIAMTFAIAGAACGTEMTLDDPDCVSVSFPEFFNILDRLTS
ncbi:MAG: 3-phosphoshikimate 1-carboxyvinyltransferase [Calditrichaeota bacterium]|nr:MAG: 3-phosphoshikimate 1-carboxyvinyltransferase [Calditrichota bacterium]